MASRCQHRRWPVEIRGSSGTPVPCLRVALGWPEFAFAGRRMMPRLHHRLECVGVGGSPLQTLTLCTPIATSTIRLFFQSVGRQDKLFCLRPPARVHSCARPIVLLVMVCIHSPEKLASRRTRTLLRGFVCSVPGDQALLSVPWHLRSSFAWVARSMAVHSDWDSTSAVAHHQRHALPPYGEESPPWGMAAP